MSPFCPGRSIADCPSPQAQTLRMWLIVQEAAGRSRAEVEAELVARYGESMLGAPRAQGFGLTAYAIPAAVVAVGAGVLAWFLRRQTRTSKARERRRRRAPRSTPSSSACSTRSWPSDDRTPRPAKEKAEMSTTTSCAPSWSA